MFIEFLTSYLQHQVHLENLSHSVRVPLWPGGKQDNRRGPPALAFLHFGGIHYLAYMDPLRIALLFCSSLIGFRVVISSTQSEHNDSFNGNHEKLCAQSGCAVRSTRDDDLLSCIDMVFASCCLQSLNLCSVRAGYQASLVHFKNDPLEREFEFGIVRHGSTFLLTNHLKTIITGHGD